MNTISPDNSSYKHIVFCMNDNWTMPCGILVGSILHYNNFPIAFHVISNDISEKNKMLLDSVVNRRGDCKIDFYKVTREFDDKFAVRKGDHVTVETYYRFFIPDLLAEDISKVLYLDCDILCTSSLKDLFETDITDYPAAMGYDTSYSSIKYFNRLGYDISEGYFCAGVMLINLDYWRKNNLQKQLIDYVCNNIELCWLHDQDALNAVCHGKIYPLHPKYNCMRDFFQIYAYIEPKKYPREMQESLFIDKSKFPEILEAAEKPALIHFIAFFKPWIKETRTPFTNVWRFFYSQSPWKNQKIKSIKDMYSRSLKKSLKLLLSKIHLADPVYQPAFPEQAYLVEKKYLDELEKGSRS